MNIPLLAAVALVAASPAVAANYAETEPGKVDVAYQAIAEGRPAEAISQLKANGELKSDDPAYLINLAAAYARQGERAKAEAALQAAIMSDKRYELELADGTWMDSRRIARKALANLNERTLISSR
jgi:predicted Zn-dependent protease